jgi:hypothetical protein
MIYLKFMLFFIVDIFLTILTALPAALIIPVFTREQEYGKTEHTWGWIWGTYDNPPQGDEGFVAKRALFVGVTKGFKGYLNRAMWMLRNPLYGFARRTSVKWSDTATLVVTGNPDISDKYKIPGSMFAKLIDGGKVTGFEYYLVKPWSETKDLRMRLGWKMTTDKFKQKGFAQFVATANPFDGYGND